jgi:hypothetical protein
LVGVSDCRGIGVAVARWRGGSPAAAVVPVVLGAGAALRNVGDRARPRAATGPELITVKAFRTPSRTKAFTDAEDVAAARARLNDLAARGQ